MQTAASRASAAIRPCRAPATAHGAVAADPIFTDQLLNRIRIRHRHHAAEAHAVRQQIANGDRALRRHRVIELRGDGLQHAAIRKFRQPRLDRFVEPQLAFLDQNHRRNGGDGFRDRSDAKDRVALHRRRMVKRQRAERLHMNVVMMTDERNEARASLCVRRIPTTLDAFAQAATSKDLRCSCSSSASIGVQCSGS